MKTEDYIREVETYSANNYKPLPIVLNRGEGVWVWDVEGKKYLDMLASYSALNQGHRHPRILAALLEQARRLTLTSRAFHNDQFGPLCRMLCEAAGLDKVLLMNTGAEAVETAIKAARKWAYEVKGVPENQAEIVTCANNFHGRTTTIISFSSEEAYRKGFGPYTPGFRIVEFGNADALRAAITPNTAAFLVEPIQGEGGILIPPDGYLREVREICDRNRVLLIVDEIQTGFGRTGRMFGFRHDGIQPDGIAVGKALGGGVLPVSAFLSTNEVMGVFRPGDHGSTFGGNPLACAVARAALAVIRDEGLVERSAELGAYLLERLRAMDSPHVREVRGRGLFVGVEVKESSGPARPFCERLKERGILCKETHEQVIRFAPPLVITKDQLDDALEVVAEILR